MAARVKAMEDQRLILRGTHCIGIPEGEGERESYTREGMKKGAGRSVGWQKVGAEGKECR